MTRDLDTDAATGVWKEAQSIVQHLEDVAEKAIQKAARTMNPVVEELTRVAKVAVVVFGLLGFGTIAVQIIRAVF